MNFWRLYNIGNNSVELIGYIAFLEKTLGKKSEMEMLSLQPRKVPDAYVDVTDQVKQFHYKPATFVKNGVTNI